MSSFKVGDIVVGKEGNPYRRTAAGVRCKVLNVEGSTLRLRVLDDADGAEHWVDRRYFYKESEAQPPKFKVGDIIVGNHLNRYTCTKKGALCEVLQVVSDNVLGDIKVRVLTNPTEGPFVVDSKYFDKARDVKELEPESVKYNEKPREEQTTEELAYECLSLNKQIANMKKRIARKEKFLNENVEELVRRIENVRKQQ